MAKPKTSKNSKGKTPQQRHQMRAMSRIEEANPSLKTDPDEYRNASQAQTSEEDKPASLTLFERFVNSVEETNRLKKHLNLDKRSRQEDPNNTLNVSSDEVEEDLPDKIVFDLLAKGI